jgi:hypothetical protein
MKIASVFYGIATAGGTLNYQKLAPTPDKADKLVEARLAAPMTSDAKCTISRRGSCRQQTEFMAASLLRAATPPSRSQHYLLSLNTTMAYSRRDILPIFGANATAWLAALGMLFWLWPIWRALFPLQLGADEAWNAYRADGVFGHDFLYPPSQGLVANNYPPLSFVTIAVLSHTTGFDSLYVGRVLSMISVLVIKLVP